MTTQSTHTPGPAYFEDCAGCYANEPNGIFCSLHKAAPEMLEALNQAKTMTNELLRTMDDSHWYRDDLVALRVRIIQAIAKAEGRS